MTLDPRATAAFALHRFGLGPRPGSIASLAADPRGALLAELERPNIGRIVDNELLTSAQASRAGSQFRAERRRIVAQRDAERQRAMGGAEPSMAPNASDAAPDGSANAPPNIERQNFLREAKARIDAAVIAEIGFVERLVWFWSNHFCVSRDKVFNMAGGYEREAIRPHVLGRFTDLLIAAESHPAMLVYLDNAGSFGPNSIAGINSNRGLNENLAREILELHTLGVRTGYTQEDVTRFANVLTGWTLIPVQGNPEHGAEFVFNARRHEPGNKTVLGKTYPDSGMEQGRAVLADLASHPSTAEHIARKLARHFVADQPPEPLLERLTKAFRDSDGDLKEMAKVLVSASETWDAPRTKLKRPSEWIISGLRAVGVAEPNIERTVRSSVLLGEPLWWPPAPQGFSDHEAAWVDGLATRLDIANAFATRVADQIDPVAMVDDVLGPLASVETRQTIERAESRAQAFALLLMSPEFQRR
jgi:uncharacterized protein (DUF1800 family)